MAQPRQQASGICQLAIVGVCLTDWDVHIPMTLKSDEIGDQTPLLISCNDISHMGLEISMRKGEVRLADYDLEKLEVARNEQSGLLMI